MFDKLKKKLEQVTEKPKEPEKPKATKKTEATEETKKPETTKKPSVKAKKAEKPEKKPEETAPQAYAVVENRFVGIREYASAMEIEEHIDKQLAQTKTALGEYLRQLDDVRSVAEKAKRLHDVVAKATGKKQAKKKPEEIDVNGLEIVVDATPLHELDALESVLRSHQQRLLALQKAKDALEPLDPLGDTEGVRYLVLEKQGIPQQILLKIS
jgi:hypothetical protein